MKRASDEVLSENETINNVGGSLYKKSYDTNNTYNYLPD
jgi:hypothetical protein